MINGVQLTHSKFKGCFAEICNAKTLTQAQHSFNKACAVLKHRAAILLYPLVKVLQANAFK